MRAQRARNPLVSTIADVALDLKNKKRNGASARRSRPARHGFATSAGQWPADTRARAHDLDSRPALRQSPTIIAAIDVIEGTCV